MAHIRGCVCGRAGLGWAGLGGGRRWAVGGELYFPLEDGQQILSSISPRSIHNLQDKQRQLLAVV